MKVGPDGYKCYCVINKGSMGGNPPEKVFKSEDRAKDYAKEMNEQDAKNYGFDDQMYIVEECDFDGWEKT